MILGIDPGTATTGFGFVRECRDGSLEAVDYGVILTPPDIAMEKRLLMLYQQLKENPFPPSRQRGGGKVVFPA